MSTLGWKPAPEFLASFASGEHPAAKEDAVPASASLMQVRWMDWMDQPRFSGCPATLRGIDLTAVGSYFRFFFVAAGSNGLCSFGWKPVSTLGWKPAQEFMAPFDSGKNSAPPEDLFSSLSSAFGWKSVGDFDEPNANVAVNALNQSI